MTQSQLFDEAIDLEEIEPTSTTKGRMRENRVASDLMSCGLLVYRLETTNGSPDFLVRHPQTLETWGVEVSGAVRSSGNGAPSGSGKGIRPAGNKSHQSFDVLALVDEANGIITYKPDVFRFYKRFKPKY